VESGSTFDGVALLGEGGASLADDIVEFLDGGDVFVDDRLVDERPFGSSVSPDILFCDPRTTVN
jgi:hypothetical protein